MVRLLFNYVQPRRRLLGGILSLAVALLLVTAAGARYLNADTDGTAVAPTQNTDAFTFVRIRYDSIGGYNESWYRYEGRD